MTTSFISLGALCLAMVLGICIAFKLNSLQFKPFWRKASLVSWALLISVVSIRPENSWENWTTIKTFLIESHIVAILTTAIMYGTLYLYRNSWRFEIRRLKSRKAQL